MILKHSSPIVSLTTRILRPSLQLFALYVLLHGHESPGGGFQAGTILAGEIILEAVAFGNNTQRYQRIRRMLFPIASIGILIYAGTGLFGLFGSGYLDYGALPLAFMETAQRHWLGILIVEAGVCLVVLSSLVAIFDRLVSPMTEEKTESRSSELGA